MKNIVAYSADNQEWEDFEDLASAREWLLDEDFSEGFSPEFESGQHFIAVITHVSGVTHTDMQANYPCLKRPQQTAQCSGCTDDDACEGTEEWPYNSEFDYVGEPVLKPVADVMLTEQEAATLQEMIRVVQLDTEQIAVLRKALRKALRVLGEAKGVEGVAVASGEAE